MLVIHKDQTRPYSQFMSSSAVDVVICRADFAINIMYSVGRTNSGNIPTRRRAAPVLVGVPRRRGGHILQFTGLVLSMLLIVVQCDKI